jgi:tripartite-type tricarboxylate transporter receptor subunit TctC
MPVKQRTSVLLQENVGCFRRRSLPETYLRPRRRIVRGEAQKHKLTDRIRCQDRSMPRSNAIRSFLVAEQGCVRTAVVLVSLATGLIEFATGIAAFAQESTADSQGVSQVLARQFPTRAVRLVEPFGRGGGPDLTARALAPELSKIWHVPVNVDNQPGAGSTLAPKLVAASPPDGYTLLVSTSAQAYSATAAKDLPYSPLRDFIPVSPLSSQAYVFVTGRETQISSLRDLISLAGQPQKHITFASMGGGTGSYVGASELSIAAGLRAGHVAPLPSEAIADVLHQMVAGRATYMLAPIPTALPAIRERSLLALGVSTSRRSSLDPEIPAIAEVGIPKFDFPIWYGVWVPAATPPDVVSRLASDIQAALAAPEMRAWLQEHGAEPMRMTQPKFAQFVTSESERAMRVTESPPK